MIKIFKKLIAVVSLVLLLVIGAIMTFKVKVNAGEYDQYVSILCSGFDVTKGEELLIKNLKSTYTILDVNNETIISAVNSHVTDYNLSTSENFRTNSAVEMAEKVSSVMNIGIEAQIKVVDTSLDTRFNKENSIKNAVKEMYEYYCTTANNRKIALGLDLYELRDLLNPRFKDELYAVNSVDAAKNLLRKYGTHLITGYELGGRIEITNYMITNDTSNDFSEELALDQKLKASVASYGGGESFSFEEKYTSQLNISVTQSKYKCHIFGGIKVADMSVDQLFAYSDSAALIDGKFMYQPWINAINNHDNLEICSISSDGGQAIPLWEFVELDSKYNSIRKYILDAYVEMCGDKYNEFCDKYKMLYSNVQDKIAKTDGDVSISGYYSLNNGIVEYVDLTDGLTVAEVRPGAEIYLTFENQTFLSEGQCIEWKVTSGASNIEIKDSINGIFSIKSNALNSTFTVSCYVNEKEIESKEFEIKKYRKYSGGSGTKNNPYIIATDDDLLNLQKTNDDWDGKYFIMVQSIDLSSVDGINGWSEIGTSEKPFNGTFDGNYNIITGYKRTDSNNKIISGLFGKIGDHGTIKNLKIKSSKISDSKVTNDFCVGILAAENNGTIENCIIENCEIDIKYTYNAEDLLSSTKGVNLVGGMLVGKNYGKVEKCGIVDPKCNLECDLSVYDGNSYTDRSKAVVVNINVGSLIGVNDISEIRRNYVKAKTSTSNKSIIKGKCIGGTYKIGDQVGSNTTAIVNVGGLIGKMNSDVKIEEVVVDNYSLHAIRKNCRANVSSCKAGTIIGSNSDKTITYEKAIVHSIREIPTNESELIYGEIKKGCADANVSQSSDLCEVKSNITISMSDVKTRLDTDNVWCGDSNSFPTFVDFNFTTNSLRVDGVSSFYHDDYYNIKTISVQLIKSNGEQIENVPYTVSTRVYNGNKVYSFSCAGLTKEVVSREVKSDVVYIEVKDLSTETLYVGGEYNFNERNIEISAILSNGKKISLDKQGSSNLSYVNDKTIEISSDTLVYGKNKINVKYGELETYFTVEAVENNVESIRLVSSPQKIEGYYSGESFNPTGLVIEATYTSGNVENVDVKDLEFYPDKVSEGQNEIQVCYANYLTIESPILVSAFGKYTISFVDYDDRVISNISYVGGETITIPNNPTRAADDVYEYTFSGWDKEISETATGDAIYKATYTLTYREYSVVFKNYDGSILDSKKYHYGDNVVVPANPTRPNDDQYMYSFSGWDSDVTNCYGDKVYTAVYTQGTIIRNIQITFVDYNNIIISSVFYATGDPIVAPADPRRASDETYDYVFNGWDKQVDVYAQNDTTYVATYKQVYIEYKIVFKNYDGSVIVEQNYHFNDIVTIPADPIRPSDDQYTYIFAGWDSNVTRCNGDKVYVATFTPTTKIKDIKIEFIDYNNNIISSTYYANGDRISVPNDPVRSSDNVYNYIFSGWDKQVDTIASKSVTYVATYSQVYIEYKVVFKNYDGSIIEEKNYHYGDNVSAPSTPTRPDSSQYSYIFSGWDSEIEEVCAGNKVYTAEYSIKGFSDEYIRKSSELLKELNSKIEKEIYDISLSTPACIRQIYENSSRLTDEDKEQLQLKVQNLELEYQKFVKKIKTEYETYKQVEDDYFTAIMQIFGYNRLLSYAFYEEKRKF